MELRPDGVRKERSGVSLSRIIVYVCLCLSAAVFLPGPGMSDTHIQNTHRHRQTHTPTDTHANTHTRARRCCCLLQQLSLKPGLFTTSDLAVCRQLHQSQGDLSSDTAGFLQDGGWIAKHGLITDFELLHV